MTAIFGGLHHIDGERNLGNYMQDFVSKKHNSRLLLVVDWCRMKSGFAWEFDGGSSWFWCWIFDLDDIRRVVRRIQAGSTFGARRKVTTAVPVSAGLVKLQS